MLYYININNTIKKKEVLNMKNIIYIIPFITHVLILCSLLLIFGSNLKGLELIKSQLYILPVTIGWLFIAHIFIQNMDTILTKYNKKEIV